MISSNTKIQNLLENVYDKRIYLFLMKCFTHLIKTIITTPGLQITMVPTFIFHQHELQTKEHIPLERKPQIESWNEIQRISIPLIYYETENSQTFVSQLSLLLCSSAFSVTYLGHLGAQYTGFGTQTLAPKKGFLTFYLKIFFKHPRRRVFCYSIYVI